VKTWDIRNLSSPLSIFSGHVPTNIPRVKRIHHPVYYIPNSMNRDSVSIITGGERSASLSLFLNPSNLGSKIEDTRSQFASSEETVYSRGLLPDGHGDAGTIATDGEVVAISVNSGEVLMLGPGEWY